MHDVLRQRLIRRIDSLPDEQVYQVLDFIEFLESKYAERHLQAQASTLQKFAEGIEDRIRRKAMNPATLREAFQLISAADKVLSNVSAAGRQIVDELGTLGDLPESGVLDPEDRNVASRGSRPPTGGRPPAPRRPPAKGEGAGGSDAGPREDGSGTERGGTERP